MKHLNKGDKDENEKDLFTFSNNENETIFRLILSLLVGIDPDHKPQDWHILRLFLQL